MITNLTQDNTYELTRLMSDFHLLTGMKICIFDTDGNELSYYPERYTAFCKYLRSFEKSDAQCRICDSGALADCRKTKKMKIYTCHAGLTECITPILIHGGIRGYIVIGQIREENSVFDPSAAKFVDEPKKLKAYYGELQSVSRKKLAAAAHILEACAGYEQLKRFVSEQDRKIEEEIEEWVESHLKGEIDVESLCRRFALSRRELYRIAQASFSCTPAEFVRDRRLKMAAELLTDTKLPVNKIAEECGIGDYNYFSKLFKKKFSLSPVRFRADHIKNIL